MDMAAEMPVAVGLEGAVAATTLMWPVAAAVEPAETVAGVLAGLRL